MSEKQNPISRGEKQIPVSREGAAVSIGSVVVDFGAGNTEQAYQLEQSLRGAHVSIRQGVTA